MAAAQIVLTDEQEAEVVVAVAYRMQSKWDPSFASVVRTALAVLATGEWAEQRGNT